MDTKRPYLVIPKLIEQPTWGGDYIARLKGWDKKPKLLGKKLGQAYELFSGTNLSLLSSTQDPQFTGELTDAKHVEQSSLAPHSISLKQLIDTNAEQTVGIEKLSQFGKRMFLLIKFTQALGNSFQIHVKDGTIDPKWKPKPESWYYFEPGVVTLGVKSTTNWNEYQKAITELNEKVISIAAQVHVGSLVYESGKRSIEELVRHYDPWQYVNTLYTTSEMLIDLSPCGIHHSWEEDTQKAPLGNVLYELQLDIMDHVATIRNFDKGKMSQDGKLRQLHIEDYYEFIDRSEKANDPQTHIKKSQLLKDSLDLKEELLLKTTYYELKKVNLKAPHARFGEKISSFRHVFVKEDAVTVSSNNTTVTVTQGHSAFIPAGCYEYEVKSTNQPSIVLISY